MSSTKMCREIKEKFNGDRDIFECELIRADPQPAILKYIIEDTWHVDEVTLKPGMVTYGFYWENKDYTLYKWLDPKGEIIADYFNIADSVRITPETIFWRDLVVDLIVYPGNRHRWLDLQEMENIVDNDVKKKIAAAKQSLFSEYWRVIQQTNLFVLRL